MSDHQEELDQQGWRTSIFSQTTEEVARAVVAAAAAVRPRPSIVLSANNTTNNKTLQKLQRQLSRVWKQGSLSREGNRNAFFNPEHLTSQKRQWTQLQEQMLERKHWKEPNTLFEHMVVVGLHPETDSQAIEAALLKKRTLERELDGPERLRDVLRQQLRGSPLPMLEPQVLFAYPAGKRLPMRTKDLLAFCFPDGLEARLVERTPSLSELHEIVYGQEYLKQDDLFYTFLMKVADNATLYGICVYVPEIVQQPPGIMAMNTDVQLPNPPLSRFFVTANRCYCLLTKMPFFGLHFDVLKSIISQERLERITECVKTMTQNCDGNKVEERLSEANGTSAAHLEKDASSPLQDVKAMTQNCDENKGDESLREENGMSAAHLEKGARSPVQDVKNSALSGHDSCSNGDLTKSSFSVSKEQSNFVHPSDDTGSAHGSANEIFGATGLEVVAGHCSQDDELSSTCKMKENCAVKGLPQRIEDMQGISNSMQDEEGRIEMKSVTSSLQAQGGAAEDAVSSTFGVNLPRVESLDSVNSLMEGFRQGIHSEDDEETEDASSPGQEYGLESQPVLVWDEVDNCPLRILCEYYKLPVPARGSSLVFKPLEHLDPLKFTRFANNSSTLLGGRTIDLKLCRTSLEVAEMQAALSAAEEAMALSSWTVATVCRVLSLENVLALFAAVLLEKQVIVICPNPGVLSAVVLSTIPLIRPFEWQSLMLPILPNKMLDFLDAPVPYIVGVQHKSAAVRTKSSSVILVNVQRDKVSMASTPLLPHFKELISALEPYHSRLAAEVDFARKHPVHIYNDAQSYAVEGFLAVLRSYLESLCGNFRSHTITNVQSNNDKVSLLLKESFVEDFQSRDHPFMKLFVDTQLFSVHTDVVLSFIESDH